MDITKTRKQGNSIILTVPTAFNIGEGVPVRPRLTSNGIVYEFVKDDGLWDFDTDILEDLTSQGYTGKKLVTKFKESKKDFSKALDYLISETEKEPKMSRSAFEKEIGL
ncbi:toxin-antitoxin system [Lentilactobacillus hilgardii]|uniref:toxin-antitoxin system n=1 Tax=Lentilactobacillus hilgardii TaxID=1588 RepID=UPI0039EAD419